MDHSKRTEIKNSFIIGDLYENQWLTRLAAKWDKSCREELLAP
jgi:hypothetical protein